MKLKGTTRIELTDVNTGEVSVVEKENMMTNVLHHFFNYNPMGVFNTLVNTRTIKAFNKYFIPICPNLLGGILLFSQRLEENGEKILVGSSELPLAYASNNANPYDDELLQMNAFNAVLFKDVIRKSETRKVGEEIYRRFYNPILNFISEDTKTYGSFYYTGGSSAPVWNCLDQVLLSKALVDEIAALKYLRSINGKSLMTTVKPKESISDHLPLLVEIR
jgi:hypothetical protein